MTRACVPEGEREHCNLSSPTFLEWDALTVFLESVMARLHSTDKPKPPTQEGIQLLRAVLAYDSQVNIFPVQITVPCEKGTAEWGKLINKILKTLYLSHVS